MGAVLTGLGSYLITQQGKKSAMEIESRGKLNSEFMTNMVKQAVETANARGENPLDTPELRKTFKSLGGDETLIDSISAHAKAQAMTPEVQARQAIFKGLMQGETPTEPGFVGPGEPRQATPEDVRGNISRLSDREAALALPGEAAARASSAETELKGAQTRANLGRAASDFAFAKDVIPAQATNLTATSENTRAQTLQIPAEVQIKRDQVANQARQVDAQLEQIRTAHADRIAELGIQQQGADTQKQIAEANRKYQEDTVKLQGEQHKVQLAQIGAQVFDKVFSQGVNVGDATAIEEQVIGVLSGTRKELDPRLARISGISPRAVERTNQLSTALRIAMEGQQKDLVELQRLAEKKLVKPEEVILQLRQRNDPIVQVYRQQEIEKDSLVGLPVPDPRAHATQNLLGLDPKSGNIQKVSTILNNNPNLKIEQIPGIDPQLRLPETTGATKAPTSTSQSIIERATSGSSTTPSSGKPEVVGIPDIPPTDYLNLPKVNAEREARRLKEAESKASNAGQLAQIRFFTINSTLPKESKLPPQALADFITLTEGGMTPNQAFNLLLEQKKQAK